MSVAVEKDGHVLLIGVDRAAERNAWNLEVIAEVAAAYDLVEVLPAGQEQGPSVLANRGRTTRSACGARPSGRHGGAGHRLHAVDRAVPRQRHRRRGEAQTVAVEHLGELPPPLLQSGDAAEGAGR